MLKSNLFWKIVILISSIIELWGCKKTFDFTSSKKLSNSRVNTNMAIIIIFMILIYNIKIDPNIRILIAMICTFIFYINNYNINCYSGLAITLIYWMILLGIDSLSMSIIKIVAPKDSMEIFLTNNIYRLESIILGKSILIVILWIYKIVKVEIQINTKVLLYVGIPIVANISSFFIIFKYIFKFANQNLISEIQILNISILLFLSNISIILVIRKIALDSKLLAEHSVMKKNIDMQYNYYMNIKENQIRTRLLYHDIKNHIISMKKLNENGYNTQHYIDSIEKEFDKNNSIFDTGSILLDIILKDKKEICARKNIEFCCSINFTKCKFIELEDICSIFSNILDNAIEACEKIDNSRKYISLEGKIVEKFFILKVENTKINKINIKNSKVITDKNDIFLHGLGINSIKKSVKKYSGETVIDHTDNTFTIKILIPIILYND